MCAAHAYTYAYGAARVGKAYFGMIVSIAELVALEGEGARAFAAPDLRSHGHDHTRVSN